jgi:hypothetical protein
MVRKGVADFSDIRDILDTLYEISNLNEKDFFIINKQKK